MSPEASGRSRRHGSTPATVGTWWQPATRSVENRWVDALSIPGSCCTALPMERLSRSKTARTGPTWLSARIEGDHIVSGLHRLVDDAKGFVHVPTQSEVPAGARVLSRSLHAEDGVFVWAWLGEPSHVLCVRRPSPRRSADRAGRPSAMKWENASILLLHEESPTSAHVAVVDLVLRHPCCAARHAARGGGH